MNIRLPLLAVAFLTATTSFAQSKKATTFPEQRIPPAESEAHMRFLAADELQGRRTGSIGNQIAARYVAEQFRLMGLKTAPGQADYYQRIALERVGTASSGVLVTGKDSLKLGKDLVIMAGGQTDLTGEVIYAGYGLNDAEDGYNGRDVKGRIVIVQGGSPEAKGPQEIFRASSRKRKLATEKGAAALVELYSESIPWGMVGQYFNREQISLPEAGMNTPTAITHAWVNNQNNKLARLKEAGQTVTLRTSGRVRNPAPSMNVAGIIEGTDPKLKDEYVIVSAHFDHVGVGKQGGNTDGQHFQRCPRQRLRDGGPAGGG
jgi:hypothetical protein